MQEKKEHKTTSLSTGKICKFKMLTCLTREKDEFERFVDTENTPSIVEIFTTISHQLKMEYLLVTNKTTV